MIAQLRTRPGLALLPLVLIPGILILVASQLRQEPQPSRIDLPQPPPEADYYLRDAQLNSMDDTGQLRYRVNAANVLHFPDQSISLDDVQVSYLDGPWTLTADYGLIPPNEESLALSGDVRMQGTLRSGESVELQTQEIRIHFADRLIESEAIVDMRSDTVSATARGLRTDMAGRELQLLSEVKVRYEP